MQAAASQVQPHTTSIRDEDNYSLYITTCATYVCITQANKCPHDILLWSYDAYIVVVRARAISRSTWPICAMCVGSHPINIYRASSYAVPSTIYNIYTWNAFDFAITLYNVHIWYVPCSSPPSRVLSSWQNVYMARMGYNWKDTLAVIIIVAKRFLVLYCVF